MMWRKAIPVLILSLFLLACPKKQAYDRPAPPIPATWPEQAAAGAVSPERPLAIDTGWRDFFGDSRLNSIVELALTHNRDLRLAALNVEKVQALYRIQRAEEYPTVTASAEADLYRTPKNMSTDGKAETISQYSISLGAAAWELDLFGRIRGLKQQALEQYLATKEIRSATQVSLVAAIASSYLVLAADREQLNLARKTLDNRQQAYELIRQSRNLGMASDLDLYQAQSQVDAARLDITRYSGQVDLDKNALNLLVGTTVPDALLPVQLDAKSIKQEIAAGVSSDVLLRRPDILAAEHRLKAVYGNIQAARAAFFPRIALTAATGLISGDLSDLFKAGSLAWSFTPRIGLPIFDRGARKANYAAVQADRDMAVAEYEKAIQTAFREVSDSLRLRTTLWEQQENQQILVDTLEKTLALAETRYREGLDGYLGVLVAQRDLYAARQGLVDVRLAGESNRVTLYKVLGGGVRERSTTRRGGNAPDSTPDTHPEDSR